MRDTKLITLIRKLSTEELKELEKFVASPFFSRGRDFVPLFKILKQFYPDFSDRKLSKEFLFKKIFPGKKFDPQKSYNVIKTLSSQLVKMCKDFLMQLEFEDDEKGKGNE